MYRTYVGILGMVLTTMGVCADVTVTIDNSTTYQTITGFGGANIAQFKVRQGPFYIDADMTNHYDSLVYDLGLSETRFFIHDSYTPITADDEPDWSAMAQDIRNIRELAARGMTFYIPAILSPPAYMKTNNKLNEGGSLIVEYYDDFARYCIDFIKGFADSTGVMPYAFSLQNELVFPEPYGSCVYTETQYRDLLKVARPLFDSAGLSQVKLYGPEHTVVDASRSANFFRAAFSDPEAEAAS